MNPDSFELRHGVIMASIIGILIVVGIGIVWFFLITNFNYIQYNIGILTIPGYIVIAFFSIAGIIVSLLHFNEANEKYVRYKRLELDSKQ